MNAVTWFKILFAIGIFASMRGESFAADPTLRIGSKAFTESVILGEILSHAVRHTGAATEHKSEMGSRVIFDALQAGQLDLYPEYTGTLTSELLAHEKPRTDDDLRASLAKRGIRMSGRLGFNNTYALGLKRKLAEELQLTNISDLRRDDPRIAQLRFAFSEEFMHRNDGWSGLAEKYRLPQSAIGMNHNLAYQGIERGAIDVTDLFSTDAEIKSYDLTVLTDDQGYFPVYHGVILYRAELAERAPQIVELITGLEGKIDNPSMVEMNARSRLDRVSESRVAVEFLNAKFGWNLTLPQENRLQRMLRDLGRTTYEHLMLFAVSLLASIVIAIPLGVIATTVPWLARFILGATGVIQTIPSLAVLALLIPLLGIGFLPAACALFLYSLLPIVQGTFAGLTEIPGNLKDAALVLGLPAKARLWRVELPLASRSILSGIKTAAVINIGTATIGGLIGAGGYGQPIMTGIRLADTTLLLQGAVPAACLALGVQLLFDYSERWLVPAGLRVSRR